MNLKIRFFVSLAVFLSIIFLMKKKADSNYQEEEFSQQREIMVKEQIEARGIKDNRVLMAMRKIKRHLFVPQEYADLAYKDNPLAIGEGQTISQPYIVALMTELAQLTGSEKVLEIGTGSGYQTAVLAELASEVYTIEILESLANRSKTLLSELGYQNIRFKCGDGYLGWPQHAPFDAIIVTCAPDKIPETLIEQLADNAKLVIPVGNLWQELKVVKKTNNQIVTTDIISVRFVPMLHKK